MSVVIAVFFAFSIMGLIECGWRLFSRAVGASRGAVMVFLLGFCLGGGLSLFGLMLSRQWATAANWLVIGSVLLAYAVIKAVIACRAPGHDNTGEGQGE